MFTRQRRHQVPKVPRRDGLTLLMDQAKVDLAAHGSTRCPANLWLAAARVLLVTRQSCGWDLATTSEELIEGQLRAIGWAWAWEGDELVLKLPRWVPPAPVMMAIQPGLFDSAPTP